MVNDQRIIFGTVEEGYGKVADAFRHNLVHRGRDQPRH